MVVDLSPQEKAERIRRWINTVPDGYAKLVSPYRDQRDALGLRPEFITTIIALPEIYPEHIDLLTRSLATLKLIGE